MGEVKNISTVFFIFVCLCVIIYYFITAKPTLTHTQLNKSSVKNFCHGPMHFNALKTPSSGTALKNHTQETTSQLNIFFTHVANKVKSYVKME
jgi:hypothetical protein